MSIDALLVDCRPTADGWTCRVVVGDDPGATEHYVRVDPATLSRLAPAATDPRDLVTASFRFLLDRESRESILRSFDLPAISRYFPDWESELAGRSA